MMIKVRRMDTKSSIYFTLSLIGIGVVYAFDEFIRQKGNENLFNFIICFFIVVLSYLIIHVDKFILRKYSEYYDFFDYTQRYLNEIVNDGTNLLTTCILYILGTALCLLINNNILHWILFIVTMVFAVIPPLITWLRFLPKQVVRIVKLHYPIAQFISSLLNVFIPILLSLNILYTYILNKSLLETQSTSLVVKLATVIVAFLILIIGVIILSNNHGLTQVAQKPKDEIVKDDFQNPRYGLTIDKPIFTSDMKGLEHYLSMLHILSEDTSLDGQQLSWKVADSYQSHKFNSMIYKYDGYLNSDTLYTTLYLCPYGTQNSISTPRGFYLSTDIGSELEKEIATEYGMSLEDYREFRNIAKENARLQMEIDKRMYKEAVENDS